MSQWVSQSVSHWQALPMIGLGSDKKQYQVELCGIGYKELAKDRLILNIKSTHREGGY